MDLDKLTSELGDVLFYLDWLAKAYRLPLEAVMQANISKLLARYPNGWVEGGGIR
jgi:NTP pyrophosphatase (non-canonical NTP hydrolase)